MPKLSKRLFVVFGALLLLSVMACTSKEERVKDEPVVVVNDEKLSLKDFAAQIAEKLKAFDALYAKHPQNVTRVKKEVIDTFINSTLVKQWAKNQNIQITDNELEQEVTRIRATYPNDIAFRGAFLKEAMPIEQWKERLRDSLLEKKVYLEIVKNARSPTEKEQQDYYNQNKSQYLQPAKVRLRQIVLEKEDDSQRIMAELKKGASFEKLAREFSIAPEAKDGGELGWVEKGTLEIFDPAFDMPTGRRSDIVKSPYGYHIFEVLGKRPAAQLNFQQAQASILSALKAEEEQKEYSAWLKKQLQSARILKNDQLISSVKVHTEIE